MKIILGLFALAYLISPVDIIPDLLLPFLGWIDDGVILAAVVYMMRYGRLPDFKRFLFKNTQKRYNGSGSSDSGRNQETSDAPPKKERNKHWARGWGR